MEGTTVELFRMLQEGVPTIEELLEQNMQQGQTLGFDGRVIAAMDGKKTKRYWKRSRSASLMRRIWQRASGQTDRIFLPEK